MISLQSGEDLYFGIGLCSLINISPSKPYSTPCIISLSKIITFQQSDLHPSQNHPIITQTNHKTLHLTPSTTSTTTSLPLLRRQPPTIITLSKPIEQRLDPLILPPLTQLTLSTTDLEKVWRNLDCMNVSQYPTQRFKRWKDLPNHFGSILVVTCMYSFVVMTKVSKITCSAGLPNSALEGCI